MEKEPIIFDGIEYEWKKVGCLFGLYPVEWGPELPPLDVSSYQPKACSICNGKRAFCAACCRTLDECGCGGKRELEPCYCVEVYRG
jgi:hypothetical protein